MLRIMGYRHSSSSQPMSNQGLGWAGPVWEEEGWDSSEPEGRARGSGVVLQQGPPTQGWARSKGVGEGNSLGLNGSPNQLGVGLGLGLGEGRHGQQGFLYKAM